MLRRTFLKLLSAAAVTAARPPHKRRGYGITPYGYRYGG
jgi:hypothetical protein